VPAGMGRRRVRSIRASNSGPGTGSGTSAHGEQEDTQGDRQQAGFKLRQKTTYRLTPTVWKVRRLLT